MTPKETHRPIYSPHDEEVIKRKADELARKLVSSVGWQPIETAPKYGERIIIYDPHYWDDGPDGGHVGEGRHLGLGDRWHFWQFPEGDANPTMWMPLPDKPARD